MTVDGQGISATLMCVKQRFFLMVHVKEARAHAYGVVLSEGAFWAPSGTPFLKPPSIVKQAASPLLETLLRTLPQNPPQNCESGRPG